MDLMFNAEFVTQIRACRSESLTSVLNATKLGVICAITIFLLQGGFSIRLKVHVEVKMDLVQVFVNITII